MSAMDDFLDGCPDAELELLHHYVKAARARLQEHGHEVREVTSYNLPALAVGPSAKQVVCGFAVGKRFCSWYPFSGATITTLADRLAAFETTKGSVHFTVAEPLPEELVTALVDVRLAEVEPSLPGWR